MYRRNFGCSRPEIVVYFLCSFHPRSFPGTWVFPSKFPPSFFHEAAASGPILPGLRLCQGKNGLPLRFWCLVSPKTEYAPVMELVDMRDLGSRAFSVWVRVPSGAPLSEQAILRLLRLLFSVTARSCFGSSAPNHSLSPLRFDLKSRPLGGFFSYSPARRSERAATLRARIFHSPDRKP